MRLSTTIDENDRKRYGAIRRRIEVLIDDTNQVIGKQHFVEFLEPGDRDWQIIAKAEEADAVGAFGEAAAALAYQAAEAVLLGAGTKRKAKPAPEED